MYSRQTTRVLGIVFAAFLAGCSETPVQSPPSAPPVSLAPAVEEGSASFFFPIEIPLSEVQRTLEQALPPRMTDERQQELTAGLQEDFYRYVIDRGPIEAGFAGGRITFAIPIKGTLTIGGRLRPVPLGRGLPVQETVDFSGWVRGTASPAITPGWQPDPQPTAQLDLGRAELRILDVFSVRVVSFLEGRLNPILNQELKEAATRLLENLGLRRRAETAWRDLHVTRRAALDEDVWIRFQPTGISLAPVTEGGNALRTGLGITGRIRLSMGKKPPQSSPASPTPLPPLALDGPRTGGFEMELPVVASGEDLARVAGRALQGLRFRTDRTREIVIDTARLGVEGDRLALALDFHTEGKGSGHSGTMILRGRPAFDASLRALRLMDLQYALDKGDLGLRLLDRLHRAELLARLEKDARLDLAPLLSRAERETAQALQGLFPPGFKGTVKVEPVQVLGVGVANGAMWARCRVAGRTSALVPSR